MDTSDASFLWDESLMPDDMDLDPELIERVAFLKEKSEQFFIEAAVAYIFNEFETSRIALGTWWLYQSELAGINGSDAPELPKNIEAFFTSWEWIKKPEDDKPNQGFSGAGVPRKPLPKDGSGQTALALPRSKVATSNDDVCDTGLVAPRPRVIKRLNS